MLGQDSLLAGTRAMAISLFSLTGKICCDWVKIEHESSELALSVSFSNSFWHSTSISSGEHVRGVRERRTLTRSLAILEMFPRTTRLEYKTGADAADWRFFPAFKILAFHWLSDYSRPVDKGLGRVWGLVLGSNLRNLYCKILQHKNNVFVLSKSE